ncbi:hypothetical protein J1G44_12660 [Cellulomonas sp. zg-ZUI199]|uniref:Energy transducer TonB n=1 Tax=Cellulomonas wangleii TaxID=2816956 RepID=A0ABX8D115_9CELL|nr:Rv3235 family protein [Cellulomonas wangleii]MBO0925329.1 hypothetical protein [Cellulomonas wangleii]QVI61176.1 hypothetical protein KG103_11765 [Cellulomonas wangleii]
MTTLDHDDVTGAAFEDVLTAITAAGRGAHPTATQPAPAAPTSPHPPGRTGSPAHATGRPRLRLVPAVPAPPARRAAELSPPPTLVERLHRLAVAEQAPAGDLPDDRGAAPATDPGRFAHGVGLACVEVVLARRAAAQLARWVSPTVLETLQQRAALVRRAGVLTHARRPAARRVRVCPVDDHTVEACLVVEDGVRVRAVALRLESHRGAWRVTALEIG